MSIDKEKTKKNIEQLRSIAKTLDAEDVIMSADQMNELLDAIVSILSNYKGQAESMTAGFKTQLTNTLQAIQKANEKHLAEVKKTQDDGKKDFDSQIETIKGLIPTVKDGEPGKDANPREILAEVMKLIHIPNELKPMTPVEIAENLERLAGDNRLDVSAIKGLTEFILKVVPQRFVGGFRNTVGGGVQSIISSDGSVHITSSGAKGKGVVDLKVTGGSSGGARYETPTGTIDGVNADFVVVHDPVCVVLNGSMYFENDGYTYNVGTKTITMLIVPVLNSTLRSSY